MGRKELEDAIHTMQAYRRQAVEQGKLYWLNWIDGRIEKLEAELKEITKSGQDD